MVFRKLRVLVADNDQGNLLILMVQALGGNRRHLLDHQVACSYDRGWGTARPEDAMIVGRAEVFIAANQEKVSEKRSQIQDR